MSIEILPDHVVAQIAAGEVVERPASVVKELVENALDAGATHIQVAVSGGGQRLIRVSDNGSGIRASEVELAFARHATSKLRSADDLTHISTLGFRGEALGSIAAVSQLTCVTRHHDEPHGTKLVIEGSSPVSRQPVGAPAGTIITVENLFYNVPARLKFLKKDTTERRQIAHIVTQYAMAYPAVRFVLEQDGREVFRSSGAGKLDDVLVTAYGVDVFKHLLPVNATTGSVEVTGSTSTAEVARNDRNRISLFVNGRYVQDSNLSYAVTQAYQGVLPQGQYPITVLMIHLPSEDLDVNVHPTKAEVRFRDPNGVFVAVQRAVREAVLQLGPKPDTPPVGPRPFSGLSAPAPQTLPLDAEPRRPVSPAAARTQDEAADEDYSHIPEGAGRPENPRTLPVLRVVGQVGARFIVAEGPAGMYLIDQHNAHCRVLYQQYRAQLATGSLHQSPELPGTAAFPASQSRMIEQAMPILRTLGLEIEPFGPNAYRVTAAPSILAGHDADAVLNAVAADLRADDPQEAITRGLCRLAAVKAGQILNAEQMQTLVRQLERTPEPFTSPDGAPTLLHMSSEQLLREFRRS